jgi:uncharacterized protein (TIGR00369 family)
MGTAPDLLAQLQAVNRSAAFNRWCGIEVLAAEPGKVQIAMPWRNEFGQYAGFLHAGLVAALIDTACGYAAGTLAGANLLAAHFDVNCLRPAVGRRFVAHAHVVRAGKLQVFTSCELFAETEAGQTLVATGQTLLTVVKAEV